jgi:Helix-turn-helix domain
VFYLTTNQLALQLGLKPQTLRKWRLRGLGPDYIRLSGSRGRVVYAADAVTRWTASRTFSSTSEETARIARRGGR